MPARATEAASSARPAFPASPAEGRGTSILLAEDNDINQQVAQGILEDVGIELQIVSNGLEAVRAVKAACTAGRPR